MDNQLKELFIAYLGSGSLRDSNALAIEAKLKSIAKVFDEECEKYNKEN